MNNTPKKYYKIEDYKKFISTLKSLGTQEQIANKLEVETKTVSKWYNKVHNITSFNIYILKETFNLTLEDLGAIEYIPDENEKQKIIFATRLHYLLKNNRMKQSDIVENLGFSKYQISHWLNCENFPELYAIRQIANFFNVSLDYLLNENEMEKKTLTEFLLEIGLKETSYNKLKRINKAPVSKPLFEVTGSIKDFSQNEILNYIIQENLTYIFKEQILNYHNENNYFNNKQKNDICQKAKHEQTQQEIKDVLYKKVDEIFFKFYQDKIKK